MTVIIVLRDASEFGHLARIGRHTLESRWAYSYGFVSALSSTLVALEKLSDRLDLDGYEVLRLRDITSCTTEFQRRECYATALTLKNCVRRPILNVDLTSTGSAVESIAANYPAVVLERERVAPGCVSIGRVRHALGSGVKLRVITPEAVWTDDPVLYRYSSITRLEFGGEYENTLVHVSEILKTETLMPRQVRPEK